MTHGMIYLVTKWCPLYCTARLRIASPHPCVDSYKPAGVRGRGGPAKRAADAAGLPRPSPVLAVALPAREVFPPKCIFVRMFQPSKACCPTVGKKVFLGREESSSSSISWDNFAVGHTVSAKDEVHSPPTSVYYWISAHLPAKENVQT